MMIRVWLEMNKYIIDKDAPFGAEGCIEVWG